MCSELDHFAAEFGAGGRELSLEAAGGLHGSGHHGDLPLQLQILVLEEPQTPEVELLGIRGFLRQPEPKPKPSHSLSADLTYIPGPLGARFW